MELEKGSQGCWQRGRGFSKDPEAGSCGAQAQHGWRQPEVQESGTGYHPACRVG